MFSFPALASVKYVKETPQIRCQVHCQCRALYKLALVLQVVRDFDAAYGCAVQDGAVGPDPLLVLICMFCVEWRAGHSTTDFMAHC